LITNLLFELTVNYLLMIHYARLPVGMPVQQIQKEVLSLTCQWHPHYNTKHYEGNWTILSLRSPKGAAEQIIPDARENQAFANTPLMESCVAIKKLIDDFHCSIMAVRLMNLHAGSVIKEHRDLDLAFEKGEARLHFPVFTNPGVDFYVNGDRVAMQEGECWYVNVNLPHKVANHGKEDRIHLVIDCVVNDWLKALFADGELVEAPPEQNTDELMKVIYELRLQNTELTNRLADELEQKLSIKS
jgi:mannose-6-phosphate isomerase-like protein (cupin superfamily)